MSGISPSNLKTFKDKESVLEIHPEIFLYKNFLPTYLNKKYCSIMESKENEWNKHGNYSVDDHNEFGDLYNWNSKLSFDFNFDSLKIKIINYNDGF